MKAILWLFLTLTINANDLQLTLSELDVNLAVLAKNIPVQEPQGPLTPAIIKRVEHIKNLYANYNILRKSPQGEMRLEELKKVVERFQPSSYNNVIQRYNLEVDEDERITQPELMTYQAFTSWYQTEKHLTKLQEIEKIYKSEKFTRIKKITTKSVLERFLDTLDQFDQLLIETQEALPFYSWMYEDLRKNPPTLQELQAWSNERRKEINEQIGKAPEPTVKPKVGVSLPKKEYCQLPKGTTIQVQKDNKRSIIILGETDLTPYIDRRERITNIMSISVFHDVEEGKLVPAQKSKNFKAYDRGAMLDFANWLKSLPPGSGWC